MNKSGTLNLVSTITVSGAWTWTAGSLNAGTSTIYWDYIQGSGAYFTPGSVTYYDINISPIGATSTALSGNLILSGTLTKGGHASSSFGTNSNYSVTALNISITNGTISANNSTITISGNFTNSATFTKGTSTIVFNGTSASTIDPGASSFNNFTVNTSSKSLLFSTANSTVISGTLTLNGGACGTQITLNSTDNSTQFTINATGTKSVAYVAVANSIATTAITATNSTNAGNNTSWTITADSCSSSSSSSATAYSFQRKTWYDGTQLWKSFNANSQIEFWYSTDWGTSWTENTTARIAVDTSDFSIEADSSYAFIAYTDGYAIKAASSQNYPGTGFSWTNTTIVFNGTGASDKYLLPTSTKDSNNKVWVAVQYYISGSNVQVKAIQSTNANSITAWQTSSILQSCTCPDKYAVLVSLGSGEIYAVYKDDPGVMGKKYSGSTWGGSSSIVPDGSASSGLVHNIAAVSDSSGYIHLVYIDNNGYVVYKEYTTSWQTGITLDSNVGNDYPTISLNTANNDLYAFWIRGNTIYYKKGVSPYASGNWDTNATSFYAIGTNTNITSNYSGNGMIYAEWTTGTGSPYSINWDYIIVPEYLWLFFPFAPLIPLLSKKRKKFRERPISSLRYYLSDPGS